MDEVMRKHLSERMREALARGDMEELQRAQVDAMCAQMECQEHMAGRVKKIEGVYRPARGEGRGGEFDVEVGWRAWVRGGRRGGTARGAGVVLGFV